MLRIKPKNMPILNYTPLSYTPQPPIFMYFYFIVPHLTKKD